VGVCSVFDVSCVCVCVCMRMHVCVCMRGFMCERQKEEREGRCAWGGLLVSWCESEYFCVCVCVCTRE